MNKNSNKMRDRLIRLFQKRSCYHNKCNGPCSNCDYVAIDDDDIDNLADYIIANGVVALPCCDYTKTNWNDCCECSAKDYCDKYNERCEIIGELLGKEIGEIKNEGR